AIIFPVGFVMLVLLGFELATGNFALLPAAWMDQRISGGAMLRNWAWVYVGNLLGSVFYAVLFYLAITSFSANDGGALGDQLRQVAQRKTVAYATLGMGGWGTAFIKAMLCNWMVTVGTILAFASRSTIDANGQAVAPVSTPAGAAPAPAVPQPIKLGDVTVTGTLRLRAYAWDWFQPTSGNNEYQYSGNFLRVNLSESRHTWQWNAELAVPFLLGMPMGATGTGPQQGALGFGSNYLTANKASRNAAMIFPRQLYVESDNIRGEKGHLKIGRFTFLDGTELAPKNTTLAALKRDRVTQR